LAGFGLVAALAWNDAIQTLSDRDMGLASMNKSFLTHFA